MFQQLARRSSRTRLFTLPIHLLPLLLVLLTVAPVSQAPASLPQGQIRLESNRIVASEFGSLALVKVLRVGGSAGRLAFGLRLTQGSARGGEDYRFPVGLPVFADGDAEPKFVSIPLVDDSIPEGDETFRVELLPAPGGTLARPFRGVVEIRDDDQPSPLEGTGSVPRVVAGELENFRRLFDRPRVRAGDTGTYVAAWTQAERANRPINIYVPYPQGSLFDHAGNELVDRLRPGAEETDPDVYTAGLVMNPDGDFTWVWRIEDTGSGPGSLIDFTANHFTDGGAPTEIFPLDLGDFPLDFSVPGPEIATARGPDDGLFVVIGQDTDEGAALRLHRYDRQGQPLGEALTVVTGLQNARDFTLAVDAEGNALVAWTDPPHPDVFVRFFDEGGEVLATDQLRLTALYAPTQVVSAASADGKFIVVWTQEGDGSGSGIFGQRLDLRMESTPVVSRLGRIFQVNSSSGLSQAGPSVAMEDDGRFLVAWTQSFGLSAQYFHGPGLRLGREFTLAQREPWHDLLSVDLAVGRIPGSGGDFFAVTWSDQGPLASFEDRHWTRTYAAPILRPCEPGPTTLCLQGGRFRVEVEWTDFQFRHGPGRAVPLAPPSGTPDTGYFWFFQPDNVEMLVKVLDGRAVNGSFWLFFGALSNVGYTLTVTDTQTGAQSLYVNPRGRLASRADTLAFPQARELASAALAPDPRKVPAGPAMATACTAGSEVLCLGGQRFRAELVLDPHTVFSRHGRAVPLGPDPANPKAGAFWFIDESNLEALVKVHDGRAVNGHFWVFFAGLTDLEFELTITDTATGVVKTYSQSAGSPRSQADTRAFAG